MCDRCTLKYHGQRPIVVQVCGQRLKLLVSCADVTDEKQHVSDLLMCAARQPHHPGMVVPDTNNNKVLMTGAALTLPY